MGHAKRVRRIGLVGGLVGLAGFFASAEARAWDSDEHRAAVTFAFQAACSGHTDLSMVCDHANDPEAAFVAQAAKAGADPDFCHSFWFSESGIAISNEQAKAEADATGEETTSSAYKNAYEAAQKGRRVPERVGCLILDGEGYAPRAKFAPIEKLQHVLYTNTNHFGDHALEHAKHYRKLALVAATRYTKASDEKKLACAKAAVGLAGFANHYMTDRTASGHAWTPNPRDMKLVDHYDLGVPVLHQQLKMVGMLGCFHGQTREHRDFIAAGTGFDCIDNAHVHPEYVWDGFGTLHHGDAVGRQFAAPFFDAGPVFYSDEQWFDNVQENGGAQFDETVAGARSLFDGVLDVMTGKSARDLTSRDTFESNKEMCPVAWGNCCRTFTTMADGSIQAQCDYCAPDITDGELKTSCPAKEIRAGAAPAEDGTVNHLLWTVNRWVQKKVPLTKDRYVTLPAGPGYFRVILDDPQGGFEGADAARGLAAEQVGQVIHPDAKWDEDNDVVGMLGCTEN
jgi:hypothetical protein